MKKFTLLKGILAVIGLQLLLIGCRAEVKDVSVPPEGYSSDATLKIAYAAGAIEKTVTDVPVPESVVEHKNLIYKKADSIDLKLDIYHSKNIKGNTPLIVFIHGGAWEKGSKNNLLHYLIPYAEMGYVTATVQYRLSKTDKWPAQLNDVESAITWLRNNAEKYHINNKSIALAGGSAGAHLAMMAAYSNTATSSGNTTPFNVQAVVNIYGPTDLTTEVAINEGRVQRLIGKMYNEAPEVYKDASPLFYVTKNAPPTISFHGTIDDLVPYEQSVRLHKKLQEVGVPSYHHELKGWPHAMDLSAKVFAYIRYHSDIFFKKHLPL